MPLGGYRGAIFIVPGNLLHANLNCNITEKIELNRRLWSTLTNAGNKMAKVHAYGKKLNCRYLHFSTHFVSTRIPR